MRPKARSQLLGSSNAFQGALEAAEKRVSELETPEVRAVDVRIEIVKSAVAFALVLAVELAYFAVILQERAVFGDADCVSSVALRSCEFCGDGTLVLPVGGDYEKNWSDLSLGFEILYRGLSVLVHHSKVYSLYYSNC